MSYRFRPFFFSVDADISGTESAKATPFAANAPAITSLPVLSKATALNPYVELAPCRRLFRAPIQYEPPVTTGGSFAVKRKLER